MSEHGGNIYGTFSKIFFLKWVDKSIFKITRDFTKYKYGEHTGTYR